MHSASLKQIHGVAPRRRSRLSLLAEWRPVRLVEYHGVRAMSNEDWADPRSSSRTIRGRRHTRTWSSSRGGNHRSDPSRSARRMISSRWGCRSWPPTEALSVRIFGRAGNCGSWSPTFNSTRLNPAHC